MALETLAIRLTDGMTLQRWFAERTLDPPPTPEQREAMEALAQALMLRGPKAERTDREDTIDLEFDSCFITVTAEGAHIIRKATGMLGLGRPADDWYAPLMMTEHGMVLYDMDNDLVLAPPGIDPGPGPYYPPQQPAPAAPPRWQFWKR